MIFIKLQSEFIPFYNFKFSHRNFIAEKKTTDCNF